MKGLPQSEACDAKRGGPQKRVRSTEDEHATKRQRSPKPATHERFLLSQTINVFR